MYTTRPLSLYKNSPEAIYQLPEGPNSGFLVIQDDESIPTCCFGLCKSAAISDLPFPQNKIISVEYHNQSGNTGYHSYDEVYLIPVLNQPLSANRYYAIKADGKHKGEAYASSRDEDKTMCCFLCLCVRDVKPRLFDHADIYQQFEFSETENCLGGKNFVAKSVASDGHPPNFLRRNGWNMSAISPKNCSLGEATGLDPALRAHLPDFNFPVSQECSKNVVVGRWYIPFMFIKEGREKDQIKNSAFYEVTLEQRWERLFVSENSYNQGKVVVDVVVPTEVIRLYGKSALKSGRNEDDKIVWFETIDENSGNRELGLSSLVLDRMTWEQERAGWFKGKEKQVRVVKEEEYGGIGEWRCFGCYVLVESFVLKRNDGSLVMTYDFMHTHKLRNKWE